MLARLFLIPAGLVLGSAAALVFLPLATLFDPVTREAWGAFGSVNLFAALAHGDDALLWNLVNLGAAISTALLAICVVPLLITALLGEAARVRSYVWYAGAAGAVAAIMPYVLRASLHTRGGGDKATAEPTFVMLFFLTGVLAGSVYWLIAGRGSMRAQPRPNVSSKE